MQKMTVAVVALAMCLTMGTAMASRLPVLEDQYNITVHDGMANANFGGGPLGIGGEDQEVEAGCLTGQVWDLEGMFFNTSTLEFRMVGGWNFINGYQGWTSGDIFISRGKPYYGDAGEGGNPLPAAADKSKMSSYLYDWVIDVDWLSPTLAYTVYAVGPETPVNVVYYTQNNGSNPWRRLSGGTQIATGNLLSQTGLTDAQTGFLGGSHNMVTFNLSGWLLDALGLQPGDIMTDDLWFHFTMQCGNDNMMGTVGGGWKTPPPVPEPASIGILGLGILGIIATRMRRR